MDCIKMDNIKMMSDELLKHIIGEKNLSIEKKIAILKIIMDESKEDETCFIDSICSVDTDGNKFWKNKNDEFHRIDGPAVEYANGTKHWFVNGKLHRTDGPAVEYANGGKHWYLNGELHRIDGPACEYVDGEKHWYLNGERHRTDGPALEYDNGSKYWYLNGKRLTEQEHKLRTAKIDSPEDRVCSVDTDGNKFWKNKEGKLHRINGPAVEYANGTKHWFVNEQRHRTDGPAVEFADGTKYWYLNGKRLTEKEHARIVKESKDVLCMLLGIPLDGVCLFFLP